MPTALLESPIQKTDTQKPLKMGDIVEGTVIGTGRSSVYLDLGPQGTGIIYGRRYQRGGKNGDIAKARIATK